MQNKKLKVAITTNIITTYRKGFYDRLFSRPDIDVTVYCQDYMPGMNLLSIHKQYPRNVKIIKFISAKKEKIVWQFLPWKEIITKYDVVFISGNPRVLSDVVLGTLLRLMGKRVVLWTMAHSYRGNKLTENIRLLWSRIFKNIFVYTDKEVEYLKEKGFKNHYILGMNNGLDQKNIDSIVSKWTEEKITKWMELNDYQNKKIIISCARLETKNNFRLVIEALPKIVQKIPNLLWFLIGGGDEEENLKKLASKLRVEKHIVFLGAIYEEEKLAPYFLSSLLFIHPAAIGLSLLHAFGYGIPVIVHEQINLHNPEIAAFEDGFTGKNFKFNDPDDLANVIITLLNNPNKINQMKRNVQKIAREQYNVDIMVDRFIQMANYATYK
jgi:glycosyltransferase involved in cell wall biosynthesis